MNSLPKLSYVLLSHNREKYIRGAIESAFAQDYEGELEYIISDDCSTDRTFEIINECVSAYKGDRRVVVTQTPRNMNLAGNTNHALQYVTGDFVIRADDDDYSTIDRCFQIARAISMHPGCSSVTTRLIKFTDTDDEVIRERCMQKSDVHGDCTILDIVNGFDGVSEFFAENRSNKVWRTDVYRAFSCLPDDAYWVDDLICQYRANVLGFCVSVPVVTVMARQASLNMSSGGNDGKRGFSAIMRLEKFNDEYMNTTFAPLEKTISELESFMKQNRPDDYTKASVFFATLREDMCKRAVLRTYWRKGSLNRLRIRQEMKFMGLFSLLRCLPMPIFAFLLAIYRKLKFQ